MELSSFKFWEGAMSPAVFEYDTAFSRNIGWVTMAEQQRPHIAIAGMGCRGAHLLTLARLGIGRFSVADLGHFRVENFNRQTGALLSTIGQAKVDVMSRMASA
jgi:tRNA A37 threonylcarbamoyladenosine dehydratase